MALVTLLSDFGTRDTYAGVVEGAILRVAPDARVLHLTHGVPPGDIAAGARAVLGWALVDSKRVPKASCISGSRDLPTRWASSPESTPHLLQR